MYVYKIKYAVVVEDENGNFIETVTDEFFDTEEFNQLEQEIK